MRRRAFSAENKVLPHGEVNGCFMKKNLAFVLSGGGSRGAMQAGALRALVEGGYTPDMVCGTSIGAINGAFLAVHGFNPRRSAETGAGMEDDH